MALLAVLVLLLLVAGSSASFIWFMSQQQTWAGARHRSAAAALAAEAGVHRALSILETGTQEGSSTGPSWRPAAYSDTLSVGSFQGRFTLSLADDADGAVLVTSAGQVAGVTRRLRARIYLASPVLLAALYGNSFVRFERPRARMVILPYSAGVGGSPWIHIAAGKGITFASANVSINAPSETFEASPGPVDTPEGGGDAARLPAPGPIRLLLARNAELSMGQPAQRVDVQQLRVMGIRIDGEALRTTTLPAPPEIDRAYFQTLARLNAANANLNAGAGKHAGDEELGRKRDSLYTQGQFERLQTYLQSGLQPTGLRGVIYVGGGVTLFDQQQITITDGALITEGMLRLGVGAGLQVTHSAATRRLPGIIVLDGALLVTQRARARAHGLVHADRLIDLWESAYLDVVGAVVGADRALSFRNLSGTSIIRYDPAVLGTPGLRAANGSPAVVWVASWEELP
jgi:hypothetical protein